jgi:hypothetical protein
MIDLEFLEKYPLATKVIKDWFHQKMIESFKDPEIAEEFKEFVLEQGMELDKLAMLINSNPRMLFDIFDENGIIIEIFLRNDNTFTCKVHDLKTSKSWTTRKEVELFAIKSAFELLEYDLVDDLPKLEE